jgi:hypothetical protein
MTSRSNGGNICNSIAIKIAYVSGAKDSLRGLRLGEVVIEP